MTHANAYGRQVAECPGGKMTFVPGEPEQDCGVDPFTGSGTALDLNSSENLYTITVENIAAKTPVGIAVVGQTLSCEHGKWEESPTSFSYQWLRNGAPIGGATGSTYEVVTADEGRALQCGVLATNASGTTLAPSPAVTVAPSPATAMPVLSANPSATDEGSTAAQGATLTCTNGSWSGSPTSYAYQWLRNGAAISGATTNKYTVVSADSGTGLQCQVTATNAGGTVAATTIYPIAGIKERQPFQPYTEYNPGPKVPTPPSPNAAQGPVTVADQLPSGLMLASPEANKAERRVSGAGWTCVAPTAAAFTCARSDGLAPESSYPPITAFIHVDSSAPAAVTNAATVAGGGASQAVSVDDPTTLATVPFGIASFSTSVSDEGGNPFTFAGGHPFAASSTFVLDYVPGEGGALITAGDASLKDGQQELPPGFVGDPLNTTRCTTPNQLVACPATSIVGYATASLGGRIVAGRAQSFYVVGEAETSPVWSLVPQPGHAAEFGFTVAGGVPIVLEGEVRSNGDYGITLGDKYAGRNGPNPLGLSVTLCSNGATGTIVNARLVGAACATTPQPQFTGPFLTTPTRCTGSALVTTFRASTWEDPNAYVSKTVYNGTKLAGGAPSATESFVTGCNLLQFEPEVEYGPSDAGTSQAGQPSGSRFVLKVPQTNEAEKSATPELRDATVTLPEGMTADPSAADGLAACSGAQFGLGSTVEPTQPAKCPLASQIGTVRVVTPLLEKPLEGQVFIGQPECSPCSDKDAQGGRLFRLFLQVRLPERGVIVKLAGKVAANPVTGRLQATFREQPQLPFSELVLTLKGGPRAPLANPQTCGAATTTTDLVPWSAPGLGGLSGTEQIEGTPDATPSSSFNVDWDRKGAACPATLPFGPFFLAQTGSSAAGQYSPLSVSLGRPQPASEAEERDEQNFAGISVNMPEGLLGKIAGVLQCPARQADAGTCSSASQIGTATVGAGAGSHPYYLTGEVYLTGPYRGDPFGLSIVVPAEAGPFRLAGNTGTGFEVVRAGIAVDPHTAALSVISDPLPQVVDGVPLRLHSVRVDVDRAGLVVNPTSCTTGQQIASTITGAPVRQGEPADTVSLSSPFAATGCSALPFHPSVSAAASGVTSRRNGASLNVGVVSRPGEANIARVDLTLPRALPSRDSTLKLACTERQFVANPAGCPEGSNIGTAIARTPLLDGPLVGPVYLVSHGGAAFPGVEIVLQGENGLEIVLDAQTQITHGITFSRFETLPDAPITSFATSLPAGPHSIFSANGNLCTTKGLALGVTLTGQNGKQTIQSVPIKVIGCKATAPLARALAACRLKYRGHSHKARRRRTACEKRARLRYAPKRSTKSAHKASNVKGRK